MRPLPEIAWILGYAGLLPFVLLSLTLLLGLELPFLKGVRLDWWLAAYAAMVLSFLGAVHWGVVLGMQRYLPEHEVERLLVYGIVPGVLAWLGLLLPVGLSLLFMALLLIGAYVADRLLLFPRINSHYARLRTQLTAIAVLMLVLAGFAAA